MAENKDNNITSVMEALVKGAESVFTTKTVVGEATKIDDTIIIPLVDVSFGIGAGASCGAGTSPTTKRRFIVFLSVHYLLLKEISTVFIATAIVTPFCAVLGIRISPFPLPFLALRSQTLSTPVTCFTNADAVNTPFRFRRVSAS